MAMADTRFKNVSFDLSDGKGRCASWEHAAIAALYDIRDELQILNRTLGCRHFLDVPHKLERIALNTQKVKRKATAK